MSTFGQNVFNFVTPVASAVGGGVTGYVASCVAQDLLCYALKMTD